MLFLVGSNSPTVHAPGVLGSAPVQARVYWDQKMLLPFQRGTLLGLLRHAWH